MIKPFDIHTSVCIFCPMVNKKKTVEIEFAPQFEQTSYRGIWRTVLIAEYAAAVLTIVLVLVHVFRGLVH